MGSNWTLMMNLHPKGERKIYHLIEGETKFDSLEALKEQLQKDRAICKKLIPSN